MGNIAINELAKDLIINIINILVLFIIVKALVYKPVKKFLDARTAKVTEMQNAAREQLESAQKLNSDKDAILAEAEEKAKAQAEEELKNARLAAEKEVTAAKSRAADIVKEAHVQTEAEHDRMILKAQSEITSIAVKMSEKILSRNVDSKDNEALVEEFLKNYCEGENV